MIYLDYAANCPVDKKVLEDFNLNSILYYANPNSTHKLGLEAKEKIDEATSYIANVFKCKNENVIYTSGSSESNNLVIKGFAAKYKNAHIITTSIEHSSIIAPVNYLLNKGVSVDILEVNDEGKIDIEELENLIKETYKKAGENIENLEFKAAVQNLIDDRTTLVSITSVESETGIIMDIEKIGEILKKYDNCFFHTDATQSIGKLDTNFENVDLITFSPHKFYGINGVGVLIKKDNVKLEPLILGGKSTTIYRSGTPALPLILSIKKALERSLSNMEDNNKYLKELNEYIKENLQKYDNVVINSKGKCIYNTINFSVRGVSSDIFSKKLEEKEIYISTKSACSSKNNVSKVVYALTKDEELSKSTLRVSISHLTTKQELVKFFEVFDEIYNELVK